MANPFRICACSKNQYNTISLKLSDVLIILVDHLICAFLLPTGNSPTLHTAYGVELHTSYDGGTRQHSNIEKQLGLFCKWFTLYGRRYEVMQRESAAHTQTHAHTQRTHTYIILHKWYESARLTFTSCLWQ